jgi:hypothetical protein
MDDKKEGENTTKTTQWGTSDPELQEKIIKGKISPKKSDPTEIKK